MQKNKYILTSAIIFYSCYSLQAVQNDLNMHACLEKFQYKKTTQFPATPTISQPTSPTPIHGDPHFLEHIQAQKVLLKKTSQIFEKQIQTRFNHQNEKAIKFYLNSRDQHHEQEQNQSALLLKEESEFSPYCSIDTPNNDIQENNISPDNTAPSLFNQSANIISSLTNRYECVVAPHINNAVRESIETVSNCTAKILYKTQQALIFDELQGLIHETQYKIQQEPSVTKQIDILAKAQMKAYQIDENNDETNMKTFKNGIKPFLDKLERLQGQVRFIIGRQDYNPAWNNELQIVLAKKIYKDIEIYSKINRSISTDWLDLLLKCTQLQPETRDVLQLACEEGIKNIRSMEKSSDKDKRENYTRFIIAMEKKNNEIIIKKFPKTSTDGYEIV